MHYIIKFITLNKELPFDIEYTDNTLNNSIVDEFINDVRITTYGTKEVKYDGFILLLDEFVRNRYNILEKSDANEKVYCNNESREWKKKKYQNI